MNTILSGLRVVESVAFVAAPSAGMTLAQMGAEVIRVDPIGGGLDFRRWPVTGAGDSLYWAGLNKAKRSVCVDLRQEEGRALLAALAAAPGQQGGIFLTNLPLAGGLAYPRLQARRADMIVVSIVGSRSGANAVDYTVNAATGFPLVTGAADMAGPVNSVVPSWDLLAGQAAALALLAAERHRRLTGEGQLATIALEDVALATLGHLGYIGEVQVNGTERPRIGNDIYGSFGRDFATGDGGRVMIVAFTAKQWRALAAATGLEQSFAALETRLGLRFVDEAARFAARDAIAALLAPWVAARTMAEIEAAFGPAGVCWGPYRSVTELVRADARCSPANPLFATVDQPGIGSYLMPGSTVDFSAAPRGPTAPAPRLGADTDAVLSGVLGLPDGEIARLRDRGVIA